ncbi:MAG: YihY/virulence factor BrkB family protein [Lachnospiraceae bacterium]|nr:YihY/virulence factor BrkB family protein [Lachnospiraceae bacterium]
MIKKVFNFLGVFFKKTGDDGLAAYAAQTAFYVILSFFPIILLIVIIASKVSFINTDIINYILDVAPGEFREYIMYIVDDIVYSNSRSFTIITIAVTLWSAGKGIQALTNGLDKIYVVEKRKNFIFVRFLSVIYTLAFMLMMGALMFLHIFGADLAKKIINKWPSLFNATILVLSLKSVFTFVVVFIFMILIYYQLPNRKSKFVRELPGAAIAALLWMLITNGFSFYIKHLSSASYMYGSLTSVILIVMWLYICMQVVFYGAEINYYMGILMDKSEEKSRERKTKNKNKNIDKKDIKEE